jgi:flavin reductase (NADH)/flavin reductase/chlorophenol-4-monooxygenase component 1
MSSPVSIEAVASCITDAAIDATIFRDALSRAVTAVTVIATDGTGGRAGVTCSAVCSVSDSPPTVLFCINRRSAANGVIKANGVISINWLHASQTAVSQLFAGSGAVPMAQRFDDDSWGVFATGAPYSKSAMVALDCKVVDQIEIGTHSVFVAQVFGSAGAEGDHHTPLVYCRRSYATTQPVAA